MAIALAAILMASGLPRGSNAAPSDSLGVSGSVVPMEQRGVHASDIPEAARLPRLMKQNQPAAGRSDSACLARIARAEQFYASAFKVVDRLGVAGPQQSVSVLRIALLRSAAAQLDTAERIAKSPRLVAIARVHHGAIFEAWGFPLDAYGWYRAALNSDPGCFEAMAGLTRTTTLLMGEGMEAK